MASQKKIDLIDPNFGNRLKQIFNGASNTEIANKLNVVRSSVTEYMRGRIPPVDKLIDIERYTGCDLHWLITGRHFAQKHIQKHSTQGIILQGCQGGAGTSLSTLMIASVLAHKGYRVLLADSEYESCAVRVFHEFDDEEPYWDIPTITNVESVYSPTENKNLDIFVPAGWETTAYKNRKFLLFEETMVQNYDFVLFDTMRNRNPFHYPYQTTDETFPLAEIIKNSRILAVHDIVDSYNSTHRNYLFYGAKQKLIHPLADFLGLVLVKVHVAPDIDPHEYNFKLEKVRSRFGSKLFQTIIDFHSAILEERKSFKRFIFTKKTKVYKNYSVLVDEILERLK